MDTGIRLGSMRKLKWKDIKENTTIPKEERKIWENIDVPAERTKTVRSYRVAAPIAKFLERIGVLTKFKKIEDYIFANQDSGKQISERIWQNNLCELLVEAWLADWRDDHDSQTKKVIVQSGKTLTWYSFRHTYITMRLSAGVPLPTVAANTDLSMKYIQGHYFHDRADQFLRSLVKVEKSSQQRRVWGGLDLLRLTIK